jgi:hypothetical protein
LEVTRAASTPLDDEKSVSMTIFHADAGALFVEIEEEVAIDKTWMKTNSLTCIIVLFKNHWILYVWPQFTIRSLKNENFALLPLIRD